MSILQQVHWLYLVVAGGVIHLVMDWFAQNHWQAMNKMKRRVRTRRTAITQRVGDRDVVLDVIETPLPTRWWDRDKAAYAHAGLHFLPLLLIFPLWAALLIAVLHLVIDTRSPLQWWGKFTRQTIPNNHRIIDTRDGLAIPLYDMGTEVGMWRDQTAHVLVLALVALLCIV